VFSLQSCGASLEEIQEEAKKALKAWDDARKSIEELELFVKVSGLVDRLVSKVGTNGN
jgi:hypothetical protein